MLLLCVMNVFILFAQNNPIFGGGNADGFDKTNFAQASNNIFGGGNADGWNITAFAQAENNIFSGGFGDGWDTAAFAQTVNNIFNGGSGDGWDKTSHAQVVNNIFNGGNGDGWDKTTFAQAGNNIFFGGQGDGWANTYRPIGPLPITLDYFTARKNNSTSSILNWKTSQEINTAFFEIERSNDAIGFKKIGTVRAAGNSNAGIEYSFIDNNPMQGMNYYHLKQIDIDGKFTFSDIKTVKFSANNAVSIYPNPSKGIVNIDGWYNIKSMELYDISGRKLQHWNTAQATIDITNFASNNYILKMVLKTGEVLQQKLIKQ
jgi:Secretion system C-terminal sorting domain